MGRPLPLVAKSVCKDQAQSPEWDHDSLIPMELEERSCRSALNFDSESKRTIERELSV